MSCAQPWLLDLEEPLSQGTLSSLDLFESTQTSVGGREDEATDPVGGEVTCAPSRTWGFGLSQPSSSHSKHPSPPQPIPSRLTSPQPSVDESSNVDDDLGTDGSQVGAAGQGNPAAEPNKVKEATLAERWQELRRSNIAEREKLAKELGIVKQTKEREDSRGRGSSRSVEGIRVGSGPLAPPRQPAIAASCSKLSRKRTAATTTSGKKPHKRSWTEPPANPLGYKMVDENGAPLEFGTSKFVQMFAKDSKVTQDTAKKYEGEFNLLKQFIARNHGYSQVEQMMRSELPDETVATFVASYIMGRINRTLWKETGEARHLDTTTTDRIFSGLVSQFKRVTEYDLYSPAFKECRQAKSRYLKDAKQMPDLGELAGQTVPLSRAQISFLLHSEILNLDTPRGLITLFFVLTNLLFLPRVRKEVRTLTRNSFTVLRNPDGSPKAVIYTPKGALKRDQGDKRGDHAAAVLKRPVALPMPAEPKLSFDIVLQVLYSHLDLLPYPGDRGTQPLFYSLVNPTPPPGSCFFLNRPMGIHQYDTLLRTAIYSTGMKVHQKQLPNHSLRPTAFIIHKSLGLSTGLFMALAGHASAKTHQTYIRKSTDLLTKVANDMQEAIAGVAPAKPDLLNVEIVHEPSGVREVRRVKDFLPLVEDGVVQGGLLPLSGMSLTDIMSHHPNIRLEDPDDVDGSDEE